MNDKPRLPLGDAPKPPVMTCFEFVALRERIGTQEDVADEMQCTRRSIGRWERGERAVPGCIAVLVRLLVERADKRRTDTAAAIRGMGRGIHHQEAVILSVRPIEAGAANEEEEPS